MATRFPSQLDTTADLNVASDLIEVSVLMQNAGAFDSTLQVNSTVGYPSAYGVLKINDEQITYSSITPTSFEGCTRGYNGTQPTNHLLGSLVKTPFVSAFHNNLRDAVQQLESVIGVAASNVALINRNNTFVGTQAVGGLTIQNGTDFWTFNTLLDGSNNSTLRIAHGGTGVNPVIDFSGLGNIGNAGQIQSKTVDVPTTAGTQLTYDGTKYVNQSKVYADVRDYNGVDFCARITAAIAALPSGGTIDTRGMTGAQSCASGLTINQPNLSIIFGNVNLSLGSQQIIVTPGTANVRLAGTQANGSANNTGGTVFTYTGTGTAVKVGDSTVDTMGFQLQNITVSITGAGSAAIALQLNRAINYNLDHPTTYATISTGTTQIGIDLEGYTKFTGGTIIHPYINNGHYGIYFGKWANANTIIDLQIPGLSDGYGLYFAGDPTGVIGGNTIIGGDIENVATATFFDYASYNFIYGLRLENIGTYDAQFSINANQNKVELFPSGTGPKFSDTASNNSVIYPTQTIFAPGNYAFGNSQDTENHLVFSSGKTSSQNVRFIGRDYDGTNKWSLYLKDNLNQFDIVDNANSLTRVNMIPNGTTLINSGTGATQVVFNKTTNAGTSGVQVWSGGASPSQVASIDGTGLGTFNSGVATNLLKRIDGTTFMPYLNIKDYGAKCDGTTDDYTAITAAIAALPSTGGKIVVPGKCVFGTALNLDQKNGVSLEGVSITGTGYSAKPASQLIYTGSAGATSAISARSTNSFSFRNLGLILKTQSFTGIGIDLSHVGVGSADSGTFTIENAYIAGDTADTTPGHTDQASALLLLEDAILGRIVNTHFAWAQRGIQGARSSAHYSNGMTIDTCLFDNLRVSGVTDAINGWTFTGCFCEGTDGTNAGPTHGMPHCYKDEFLSTGPTQFTWIGGWVGDAVAVPDAWFLFNGGANIVFMNPFMSNSYTNNIKFLADATGIQIIGGGLSSAGSANIDLNSKHYTGLVITGVEFSSSTSTIGNFTCPTRASQGHGEIFIWANHAASGNTPPGCIFTPYTNSTIAMESGGYSIGGLVYGTSGFNYGSGTYTIQNTGGTGGAGGLNLMAGGGGIDLIAGGTGITTESTVNFKIGGSTYATISSSGLVMSAPFTTQTVTFASLGTPANGTLYYCSDCTIANPCSGSGTGALAKRLNSVWVCN